MVILTPPPVEGSISAICAHPRFKLVWSFRGFAGVGPRLYALLYTFKDGALIAFASLVMFAELNFFPCLVGRVVE